MSKFNLSVIAGIILIILITLLFTRRIKYSSSVAYIAVGLMILFLIIKMGYNRNNYALLDDAERARRRGPTPHIPRGCESQCLVMEDGSISDQYGCCECSAAESMPTTNVVATEENTTTYETRGQPTVKSSTYERLFRGCMCKAGHEDFCMARPWPSPLA